MSLSAVERAALTAASKPPGPATFWYALGTAVRTLGKSLDAFGAGVMGEAAAAEKLPIPTTAIKMSGKAPTVSAAAAFVAPSANLIGSVTLGSGSSVWYASMLKDAQLGELSSVGDRSIVTDSIVGNGVCIGPGSIITAATVGSGSSIGAGCKVLKGASVGEGSVLTAGSVLPAGASVPSGEVWSGVPAAKVERITDADVAGIAATAELTADMGRLHMDHSWKDLALVEQEHGDYKRQRHRTPEAISSLRQDPGWVPLPTLGGFLSEIGAHSQTYVPK